MSAEDRADLGVHVAIDARLPSGRWGGVEQVILGLSSGLATVGRRGHDKYSLLVYRGSTGWIRRYATGPVHLQPAGWKFRGSGRLNDIPLPQAFKHLLVGADQPARSALPLSTGLIERLGADVVHFTTQSGAFRTDVPSIYQPHDLQHLHLPQFFSQAEIDNRERVYRAACEQASMVVAMSNWGRDDLISHYGLPPQKVHIIPWAPVLGYYPNPTPTDLERVRATYKLPDRFLLYPAQTWPHKNHIALLRALSHIRTRHGIQVALVCTGRKTPHFDEITEEARRERVTDLLTFTGFVSPLELRALYRLAHGLVFPSLFEGWGMPVLEAFSEGLPATCSSATLLPQLTAGAAIIFDANDRASIADAVLRLWEDDTMRRALIRRGHARVATFSWEHTAQRFISHYRRIDGRTLTDEDRLWLQEPAPV